MAMLHVLVMAVLVAAATSFVLQPVLPGSENAAAAAIRRRLTTTPHLSQQQQPTIAAARLLTVLEMAEGENEVKTQQEAASSSAEEEEEQDKEEEQEAKQQQQQETEDPELTALKEEIKTLESTLKSRRQQVQTMQDRAEHYSKAGYARKVAEMENMRRDRSVSRVTSSFVV